MSIPFKTYSCSDCNLHGLDLLSAGLFIYAVDEEQISVPRSTGYCATCDAIAPVERLTVRPTDLAALAREFGPPISEMSWWRRLLLRLFSLREVDWTVAYVQGDQVEKRMIDRITATGRGAVCLRCGSDDILHLRLPTGFRDDGSLFSLGLAHPGCGGVLLVNGSNGERRQPEIETRLYDWRSGRQRSGPPVLLTVPIIAGYAPGEELRERSFDI